MKRCLRLGPWSTAACAAATLLAAGCAQSPVPAGLALEQAPAPERGDSGGTAAKLYVLDSNIYSGAPSVAVFGRDADGNVAPARTIEGADTGMYSPGGIAVDRNGRIYVSDFLAGTYGAIFVYAAGASGDAQPIATITDGIADPCGVAVDDAGNVYEGNFEAGSVNEYAADTYQLVRTITAGGSLGYCAGLAVGRSGKIYVLVGDYNGVRPIEGDSSSYYGSVAVLPAGASGPTKPSQIIEGPETGLTDPLGIAVDATGRIFVTNADKPIEDVLVFGARANGDAAPKYRIAGSRTQLVGPTGIALDKSGAIFVTNYSYVGKQSVLAYTAGSRGNVAPARKIKGKKAQLQTFTYIAVK
ncbi:MAG: hypothetical protein ABSF08_08765 [Candidatus Cybelea sp.]